MSTVLESFNAAEAAVTSANHALAQLRGALGLALPNTNGTPLKASGSGHPKSGLRWNSDPVKKARAIARFKRTMKARRLARQAALSHSETPAA